MINEAELDVSKAISILKQSCYMVGKRHNRIHDNVALDNVHRLRAIDGGICGLCPNVRLEGIRSFVRPSVMVKCHKGYSPLGMYRRTDLGKIPECSGYDK